VAIRLNNLVLLLRATIQLAEAELLMHRAFVIFLSSLELNHPNSQIILQNYRKIFQDQGLTQSAIQAKIAFLLQQD
jgi:hypothetical protein